MSEESGVETLQSMFSDEPESTWRSDMLASIFPVVAAALVLLGAWLFSR